MNPTVPQHRSESPVQRLHPYSRKRDVKSTAHDLLVMTSRQAVGVHGNDGDFPRSVNGVKRNGLTVVIWP